MLKFLINKKVVSIKVVTLFKCIKKEGINYNGKTTQRYPGHIMRK